MRNTPSRLVLLTGREPADQLAPARLSHRETRAILVSLRPCTLLSFTNPSIKFGRWQFIRAKQVIEEIHEVLASAPALCVLDTKYFALRTFPTDGVYESRRGQPAWSRATIHALYERCRQSLGVIMRSLTLLTQIKVRYVLR